MRDVVTLLLYFRSVTGLHLTSQPNHTFAQWPFQQSPQPKPSVWPQFQWPQSPPSVSKREPRALAAPSAAIGSRKRVAVGSAEALKKELFSEALFQDSKSSQSLKAWSDRFAKDGHTMPLTSQSIIKAADPGFKMNRHRLHRALKKFLSGGHLHIVVVGGSFTTECQACRKAWPSRLEGFFNEASERLGNAGSVTVQNLAFGGTTSAYMASRFTFDRPKYEKADIVICEYNINDMSENLVNRSPNVTLYKKQVQSVPQTDTYIKLFYRLVQRLPNSPAFVYYDLTTVVGSAPSWNSAHMKFAASVQAPFVWFLSAVEHTGRSYIEPGIKDPDFKPSEHGQFEQFFRLHPLCTGAHDILALVIFKVLERDLAFIHRYGVVDDNDGPLPALSTHEEEQETCLSKVTFFAAADNSSSARELDRKIVEKGAWELTEERSNKKGWVAASGAPTELVIDIPLSRGIMYLTVLRSYEGFGSMRCSLELDSTEVGVIGIDGSWKFRTSLPDIQELRAAKDSRRRDLGLQTYRMRCKTDGKKMKIVVMTGC